MAQRRRQQWQPPDDFEPWQPEPAVDDFVPWQPEPAPPPPPEDNYFAQFVQPQPPEDNYFAQFVQQPDDFVPWQPEQQPEAEGTIGTALRSAAHAVLPSAAGLAAVPVGIAGGAALGLPAAGWGAIPGAVVGGISAYYGASKAQEAALKAMGFDDSQQLAVNTRTNPKSALAGEVLGALPTVGVGAGASAVVRAGGALGGGLLEAGSQALGSEPWDPTRIGGAAIAGGLLTKPTRLGEAIGGGAARAIGRPELWHGAGGPDAAAGTAKEQPPPRPAPDAGAQLPTDYYAKAPRVTEGEAPPAAPGEPRPQVFAGEAPPTAAQPPGPRVSDVDPAVDAAINKRPIEPQVTEMPETAPPAAARGPQVFEEPPTRYGPALDREFPRVTEVPETAPPAAARGPQVFEGDAPPALAPVPQPPSPREAMAQRAPGETYGAVLRRLAADERGGGRPPSRDDEPGAMPTPRNFDVEGAALPDRSVRQLEARGFTPEQIRAMPPEQRYEILQKREGEVGSGPVGDAMLRREAEVRAGPAAPLPGQPTALTPTGGGAVPPAAAPPGKPPPPPTVGQAAAAAGGTPPPSISGPSMAYAPRQQRSNLSELARAFKLALGADIGPHGRQAETIIRGSYGDAQRVFEQTLDLTAPHQATIHAMTDPLERRAMVNRMEGENRFPGYKPTPEQQKLINDHKTAMGLWEQQLSRLDRTKQMDFVANYLPHMYENPEQAQTFFTEFARRGGAGSTKKRVHPTYEDAIAAGLKPLTDNPIELAVRYGMSMKNFIAANDVLERGVASGHIGYFKPGKSVGAAGSPEPLQVGGPPPGWEKLNSPTRTDGLTAYAPMDFADKYNIFYSRGLAGGQAKPLFEAARNANSAWTQLELGLNSYHLFTMANEAIISDVKRGLNQIFSGQFKEGAKSIATSPLAPRSLYVQGKRFQREYLDPNSTNPIASILAEANARPIGRGHAADILGAPTHPTDVTPAARGSFIKNFSRDKINFELEKAWSDVKGDWGLADSVGKQALFPFRQASRALQTIGAPLFDKYIPALKAGVVSSHMEAWIKANPDIDIHTPDGRARAVAAARKFVDSTDNMFGEMIHDNLFMNNTLRQSAITAMRSFSWTVGAMREIGGGTAALGKAAVLSVKNRENRFSMAHPEFDARISYPLAIAFVVGTTDAIYQYLKTGEGPQDIYDLYAPRTGGTVPGLGGKGQVPEHVLMPGFHKDVYGWLAHPWTELYAKRGGLNTTLQEQLTNQDWRGDPIYRRGAGPMEHLSQRMDHFLSRLGPIGVKNFVRGQPETSEIPAWQTALGFRAPGAGIQDPKALERWSQIKAEREWKAKLRHAETERRKYARTPQ